MAPRLSLRVLLCFGGAFALTHAYGLVPAVAASAIGTPLRPQAHPGLGNLGAMAQTPDGFLWFGGREGLKRYDGLEVRTYAGAANVPFATHGVHSLLVSKQGGMWVATGDGILGYWSDDSGPLFTDKRGKGALVFMNTNGDAVQITAGTTAPSDTWVWSMAEDGANNLWLGTDQGLGLVRPHVDSARRRIEWVPCDGVTHDTTVANVLFTSTGLWLATDRGVFVRRNGRCQATAVTAPALALAQGSERQIFVGTKGGLIELVDDVVRRQVRQDAGLPSGQVRSLLASSKGSLWVGTDQGLVTLDSSGHITPWQEPRAVITVFQDDEGSVWYLTTSRGAVQLKPAPVTTIAASAGQQGATTFAVLTAKDGSVWATTTEGLTHFRGARIDHYAYGKDVPVWSARAMAEAPDGGLWFTVHEDGLLLYKDGAFESFPGGRYPHLAHTTTVAIGRDASLWVGTSDGRVMRLSGGAAAAPSQVFSPDSGACRGSAMAVAQAPDGTMWWATSGGLTRIQNGEATCFSTKNGLPSNDVASLLLDQGGTLWLGTRSDVGLVNWRDGVARVVGPDKGFPMGGVFGIVQDTAGHLWWSSAMGIHRASRQSLLDVAEGRRTSVNVQSLGVEDGLGTAHMTSAFAPAGATTADGHLLFPSVEGVAMIDAQSALRTPAGVRPIIESIRVDGVELPPADRITSKRGSGDVELRFTSPTFLSAHRLRFEHLLEGFDARWISAEKRRTAHYTNLKPGRYRFRVRCVDDQGSPSKMEDSLSLTVPARIDQTLTFRLSVAALLVLAMVAAYRRRIRMIHERSAHIHLERDRIARDLHDHLGQGLGAIGYLTDAIGFSADAMPAGAKDLLGKLRRVVSQTNQGINDLIWDLRHVNDRGTLRSTLVAVAERGRDLGLQVSLTMSPVDIDARKLAIREVPFVVQEAITNAAKHGGAKNIDISVKESDGAIEIQIADDGSGMKAEPEKMTGGFGITGMRERARRMNASLELRDNPARAHGVVVVVRIPL